MTDVDALVAFIRARLAEDDRIAHRAGNELWIHYRSVEGPPNDVETLIVNDRHVDVGFAEDDPLRPAEALHIGRHSPAHALREVEAKRRHLARYNEVEQLLTDCPDHPSAVRNELLSVRRAYRLALQDDAAIWSDHPDYLAEWAP